MLLKLKAVSLNKRSSFTSDWHFDPLFELPFLIYLQVSFKNLLEMLFSLFQIFLRQHLVHQLNLTIIDIWTMLNYFISPRNQASSPFFLCMERFLKNWGRVFVKALWIVLSSASLLFVFIRRLLSISLGVHTM